MFSRKIYRDTAAYIGLKVDTKAPGMYRSPTLVSIKLVNGHVIKHRSLEGLIVYLIREHLWPYPIPHHLRKAGLMRLPDSRWSDLMTMFVIAAPPSLFLNADLDQQENDRP